MLPPWEGLFQANQGLFYSLVSDREQYQVLITVVEKEQKSSPDDMDTITMWAELSSNVADALPKKPSGYHVQNVIISRDDIAKIHQDAENAIKTKKKQLL